MGPPDLPFDVVELVPCAPDPATDAPGGAAPPPLREMAFRADAWAPDEADALRRLFAEDRGWEEIGAALGRPPAGVATKAWALGLRRNSSRAWTEWDDAELARRYGGEPTSEVAARLGRSPAAVHARAGALGLTEGVAPPYTEWEIAQVRAAYARGVPVAQLAVLIARPVCGIATVAARLGLRHAAAPADWTAPEAERALALAAEGARYRAIAARLAGEGFPARSAVAVGQTLRGLGYGRGWGRPWTAEEDALLRRAYAEGRSLAPLRERLGRDRSAIAGRAGILGLAGTHARPNGFRAERDWTEEEIAALRRDYGRVPTRDLAATLGRKLRAVYSRAHELGLVHGWIRPFSPDEDCAVGLAHRHGVSIRDLAEALGRDVAVVGKRARRALGIDFARRPPGVRAPRTPRAARVPLTLAAILALGDAPGAEAPPPAEADPAGGDAPAPPVALLLGPGGGGRIAVPAALLPHFEAAGLVRRAAPGSVVALPATAAAAPRGCVP